MKISIGRVLRFWRISLSAAAIASLSFCFTQSAIAHSFHAGESPSPAQTPPSAGWIFTGIAIALILGVSHALSLIHAKPSVISRLTGTRKTVKLALKLGLTTAADRTALLFSLGSLLLLLMQYEPFAQIHTAVSCLSGVLICLVGFWILDERLHPTEQAKKSAGHRLSVPLSALVLWLSAIAFHKAAYGLLLLLTFSLGLATVIAIASLIPTYIYRKWLPYNRIVKRLPRYLSVASSLVCIVLGLWFTVGAIS